MLLRTPPPWHLTEAAITPEPLVLSRRRLLTRGAAGALTVVGGLAGGGAGLASGFGGGPRAWAAPADPAAGTLLPNPLAPAMAAAPPWPGSTTETPTREEDATSYNNFYEFGPDKDDPQRRSGAFRPLPWTVTLDGLVEAPQTLDFADLVPPARLEERILRLRCVETWSMVLPWIGVPLATVIERARPLGSARYVAFETVVRPEEMPGQRTRLLEWPYREGLRLDEARHPLAFLAVGLYGKPLLPQNGAPLRLVVPWKYGFKSIKSIVRITLTESQPPTTWSGFAPSEYGFYANVNPSVDHPRWSQARERRIGDLFRRDTLPFNGYAEAVAGLYTGMDLRRFY